MCLFGLLHQLSLSLPSLLSLSSSTSKLQNSKSNIMAALLKEYRLVILGEGG